MSEQQAEQISGEPSSLSAGPAAPPSSDAQTQSMPAASLRDSVKDTPDVASPGLVPEQGAAAEVDASKADPATAEGPKGEAPKVEPRKVEPPKAEVPRAAGKVTMSVDHRDWGKDEGAGPERESEQGRGMFGKRRLAALAAVAALAVVAGAAGGVLANTGLSRLVSDQTASAGNRALEASAARMEADILALKTSVEHISKMAMSQYNKTSDRLDKIEKAQAEPAAKLARLSEAVDKLRAAAAVASVPAAAAPAAKEVTGSISPSATATAAPPKAEVGRLPRVEGWVLHEVANGAALIEGRRGIYEVSAGDPVPGLGRVDAIRRQDGRWVVVTSKGLVVAR